MAKSILKWGAIMGSVMAGFMFLSYLLVAGNEPENMGAAEVAGYVAMVASLAIIGFAMHKQFRGQSETGSLWRRIFFGSAVALVAGIIFGVFDVIYSFLINPGFMDAYFEYYLTTLPVQEGPEYEEAVRLAMAQREMFASPLMIFLVMGATVWMIGIVISVLGGLAHYIWTKSAKHNQKVG